MTGSVLDAAADQWSALLGLCGLQIIVGIAGFFSYRGHARGSGRGSRLVPTPAADWNLPVTILALLQYLLITAGTVVVLATALPLTAWARGLAWVPLIVYFGLVGMMTAVLFPKRPVPAVRTVLTPLALALLVHLAAGGDGSDVIGSELVYTGAYFTIVVPAMLVVLFIDVGRHQVSGSLWVVNVLVIAGMLSLPIAVLARVLPDLFRGDAAGWIAFVATAIVMLVGYVRAWHRNVKPLVDAGVR